MGGESSRAFNQTDLYSGSRSQPEWCQSAVVPIDLWKSVCNPAFCIDYFSAWRNRQFRVHKRPWSSFVIQGKHAISGKDEKVCSFTCKVIETGREEKLKGWLKDSSVIAFQSEVAVIQLVLPRAVKLLVINWHSNCLLATYTFAFNKEPCVQECFLSPDASVMLCRQNFWLRRKLNHLTTFDPNIRVIQIKDGLCRRLFVIEDTLLTYGVFGSGVSVDPRYPAGRVAVISSTIQIRNNNTAGQNGVNNMQIYDLPHRQVITARSEPSLDHVIHHAQHTPDGRMIAVVLVTVSMYVTCTLRAHELQLFDSDTMEPLHSMSLFDHVTKPHVLTTFPSFSRDCTFLAQATGTSVHVLKLPQRCTSLQDRCRLVIRQHTQLAQMSKLPLPKAIQSFLNFQFHQENFEPDNVF